MSDKWNTRVKARLKALGYRHDDLAERLNVTRGAATHYLNGIREPSINQIKEIAKMLDMSVSELLGDDAVFISDENQIRATEIMKELPKDKQELAIRLLESLKEKD